MWLPETQLELGKLGERGDVELPAPRVGGEGAARKQSKEAAHKPFCSAGLPRSRGSCTEQEGAVERAPRPPTRDGSASVELKRNKWQELRNHVAGRCGKAPHALWELTPRLVRLLEAISVLHGMKTQAQLLYPWSSVAERRPPKPSTNAMSRLLHMDMVMDMQAGLE